MLNKNAFVTFLILSAVGTILFFLAPVIELLHNMPIKQEVGAWLMPLVWLAVCGLLYLVVVKVFFKVFPTSVEQKENNTSEKDTKIFVLIGHVLIITEPALGVIFSLWNLARVTGLK